MEVSWYVCLNIAIALTTVGLTLTWERLRQHSKTIDAISTQTQYLTSITYWTMLRVWQRMEKLEEDVQTISMDIADKDQAEEEKNEPNIPGVYTDFVFDSNPFDNTLSNIPNTYPWSMNNAPWTATSHVPASDSDEGSTGEADSLEKDLVDEKSGMSDKSDGEIDVNKEADGSW